MIHKNRHIKYWEWGCKHKIRPSKVLINSNVCEYCGKCFPKKKSDIPVKEAKS